jgi:hypothetical protein
LPAMPPTTGAVVVCFQRALISMPQMLLTSNYDGKVSRVSPSS